MILTFTHYIYLPLHGVERGNAPRLVVKPRTPKRGSFYSFPKIYNTMETKTNYEEISRTNGLNIHSVNWEQLVKHFHEYETPLEASITIRKLIGHLAYCMVQVKDLYLLETKSMQNDIFFASVLADALEKAQTLNMGRYDVILKEKKQQAKK